MAMTPDQLAAALTARLDGPHTDQDTAGAARLAAETVRYLNHATGPHAGQGLTEPATAYDVTGQLTTAIYGLPQLCGQLAAWLEGEHTARRLGDDNGGPAWVLTSRARFALEQAARHADALGRELACAQSALATMHRKDERQTP